MIDKNTITLPGQVEEKNFCIGKYPIGTNYLSAGKNPRLCTITDCLKTYNSKGLLVKVGYESTHEFAGQVVTDRDVCTTSVARGITRLENLTKGEQA